ncbi:MAG TPA: SCO family protein [Gammaproteobacteria bacterium]|nr:SCO family protein [Gammaproteobacteria bacterium]
MNKTIWLTIFGAIVALAIGLAAGWLIRSEEPPKISGLMYPAPRPIPEISLVNQAGEPFTLEDFRGQWSYVFFGFTHCPDVCPTTLATLNRAVKSLDKPPQVVLVSVDPARDTPKKLDAYLEFFNPDFIGVTGSQQAISALAQALGIAFVYVPQESTGSYTVDHTAAILLVNPQAQVSAIFTTPHKAENLAQDFAAIRAYAD